MPLDRFYNLEPERQQAILDAGRAELVAHGASASLNRIIRAAGVSKGAFYYYFEDREDLCEAVVADVTRMMLEGVGTPTMPSSPEEFWRAGEEISRRALTVLNANPDFGVMARLVHSGGAGERARRYLYGRLAGFFERFLDVGIALGAIRTDVPHSLLVSALTAMVPGLHRWLVGELETRTPEEMLEARAHVLRLCRDFAGPKSQSEEAS